MAWTLWQEDCGRGILVKMRGDLISPQSAGKTLGLEQRSQDRGYESETDLFQLAEPRLGNITNRVKAVAGDQVTIGEFVITGEDPKRVLIRALGPVFTKRQISDPVPDLYMVP